MFSRIKNIWKEYGFTITLILCVMFMFCYWLFDTRKKGKGTYETIDGVLEKFKDMNKKIHSHPTYQYNKQREYNPHITSDGKNQGGDSKGERECRRVLQKLLGKPFDKIRPKFLFNSITGDNLEFDMYDSQLQLAVEYNGRQHYEYTPFFQKTKDAFRNQQYRDKMKRDISKKLNIVLIEVPYTVKIRDIEEFLVNQLRKYEYIK